MLAFTSCGRVLCTSVMFADGREIHLRGDMYHVCGCSQDKILADWYTLLAN